MTERLYYTDCYRTAFEATVTSCTTRDGRIEVTLDRTAFYPTAGGQPFDVGVLAGSRVQEVFDRDDGEIVHVVDQPLQPGILVQGRVDWTRRFDHMQQHTGQHVLSAAFDRLFGIRTESFHLGSAASTIDLAREMTQEQIRAAEDEANRVVWEDRAVHIRFATPEEAALLPLRKEPVRAGPLRLIEIEGVDLSACGGTHVARTGAIGIIAIAGVERVRKGTRVEFLCGGRALERFRSWRDALAAVTRHLSVAPSDLAPGVEKLQHENKALQRALRARQEALAAHEAAALVARAGRAGDRLVLAQALDGWGADGLKALVSAATHREARLAVALVDPSAARLVVVAAGAASGVDASAVIRGLTARFGGRGGGRRDLAQGGGLTGGLDEVVAEARRLLAGEGAISAVPS